MADNSSIVNYIKEQLSAGYSEKEIRDALLSQGWYSEEIDKAFSAARAPAPTKPAAMPAEVPPAAGQEPEKAAAQQPRGGIGARFILSLAGGALVILNSILSFFWTEDLLDLFVPGVELSVLGTLGLQLSSFDSLVVNLMIGGFLVAAAFIIHAVPDRARLTGIFMLILSVITVMIGNGFLIGGIIAIIGGALAILKS
jgi:hypothetical protein